MDSGQLKSEIAADLFRIDRRAGARAFLGTYFRNPCFRYIVLWRLRRFLKTHPFRFGTYDLVAFLLSRSSFRLGIRIPYETVVGPGLYIPHHGGIWVNSKAVIGRNCNISQGVTIGGLDRGEMKGAPTIGNHVYLGPNSTIVGNVTIGNHALIGANSLIVTDVPDNAAMMGVPAKLFSKNGSADFVNNTDYSDEYDAQPDE